MDRGVAGQRTGRLGRTRLLAAAVATVSVASACGTRLDDAAFSISGEAAGAPAADVAADGEDAGPAAAGDDAVDFSGLGGSDDAGGAAAGGDDGAGSTGTDGTAATTGSATTGSATSGSATTGTSSDPGGSDGSAATAGTSGGGQDPTAANEESDVGVFTDRIKVGNIVDKGGALGPHQFTPSYYGANAYFAYLNAVKGGIHGRQVEFITCDSKESGEESIRCAERLIEDEQVFALVANNLRNYAAAEYVSDNGVPDVGGEPIGNEYYAYPTLFPILQQGYPRDGTVGFDGTLYWAKGQYEWFAANTGITKAAVFYYSIPISKQTGLRIVRSLEDEGIETIEFEINPALPNFDSAVVTMQNEGVDAIFDTMDANANRNMCDSMQRRGFSVKVKNTTAAGWSRRVRDTFSDVCRPSMYVAGNTRPISERNHPEVKLFNDVMNRVYDGAFDKTMHQWHFEGWLAAKMFAREVEAMGPTPTRQGLIDRLNGFRNDKLDGSHSSLDWFVRDYETNPPPTCTNIAKWSDEAGDFVTVVGMEDPCIGGSWFPFEASA